LIDAESQALDEEMGVREFFISHPGDKGRDGSNSRVVHALIPIPILLATVATSINGEKSKWYF
jgi:hypothetical protein